MRKALVRHRGGSKSKPAQVKRVWVGLALLLILCIGLGLRMRHLSDECPWFDEIITIRHLDAPNLPAFLEQVRDCNEPVAPAYLTLEYVWAKAFGCSWYGLRLLSVAIGMATIVALFELTAVLFGPLAGLLAALALALNVTHIYYSQEIRMYVLSGFLAVLSVRSFIAYLDKGGKANQAVNTILNLLLVWTHPVALIVPGVEALHLLLFKRRPWRYVIPWLLLQALVGLSIVLWALGRDRILIAQQLIWLKPPLLLVSQGRLWSLQSFYMFIMGTQILMRLKWIALLTPPALALIYLWLANRDKDNLLASPLRNSRETAALLLSWLFVPTAAVFALSYLWRPCFLERYLIFSTFPLYMIFGALVVFLKSPAIKGAAILSVVIIMSLGALILPAGPFRRPTSQLASLVRSHAQPGDKIVLDRAEFDLGFDFKYYLRRDDLAIETADTSEELRQEIAKGLAGHASIWIVGAQETAISRLVRSLGFKCSSTSWPANAPRNAINDVTLQLVHIPKQTD